jgi:7-carboxy-7-deazaguanine synthase
MQYPINEIFYSLQGEAFYAGLPAMFIRLQGCAVGCAFCDTKHTWELKPAEELTPKVILDKTGDKTGWAYFSIAEILSVLSHYPACRHVVLTGGEPAQYDLRPLILALELAGMQVQIETSGTEELNISPTTWVTLSPKIDMPGHKQVLDSVIKRANEIKMPVGKIQDVAKLEELLARNVHTTQLIWLQPLSCKDTPTQLCIETAMSNNWRVSTQIHKYIHIR